MPDDQFNLQKVDEFVTRMILEPNSYEERYVAFIDIIGFCTLINSHDAAWIKRNIYDEIRKLDTILHSGHSSKNFSSVVFESIEIVIISDSVIISIPVNVEKSLDVLLFCCVSLQNFLFLRPEPILIRGGISVGEYLHFDQVTYGPALVKAFKLESEVAIYPRIVIDKNISITKLKESTELITNPICKLDLDGYQFLDYLVYSMLTDEDKKQICDSIRGFIEASRLKYLSDDRKYAKYNWLATKYNEAITTLIEAGKDYNDIPLIQIT